MSNVSLSVNIDAKEVLDQVDIRDIEAYYKKYGTERKADSAMWDYDDVLKYTSEDIISELIDGITRDGIFDILQQLCREWNNTRLVVPLTKKEITDTVNDITNFFLP